MTQPARPKAAVIEIVERLAPGANPDEVDLVVPNEIRLNGVPLLASADDPVIVHEISTRADELVRVTLTLFARRVTIGAEATGTVIKDAAGNVIRVLKD